MKFDLSLYISKQTGHWKRTNLTSLASVVVLKTILHHDLASLLIHLIDNS